MPNLVVRVVEDDELAAEWMIFEDEPNRLVGVAVRRSCLDRPTLIVDLCNALERIRRRHPARAA